MRLHLTQILNICIQNRTQHVFLIQTLSRLLNSLGGSQTAADHFLQGTLHIGISVIPQNGCKAHHRRFTHTYQLAQLTGRHKRSFIIIFQNISCNPFLSLGKITQIAFNRM